VPLGQEGEAPANVTAGYWQREIGSSAKVVYLESGMCPQS
jgi:hypothetical protein